MKTNRWGIAVAGGFLQMALGAVYAWSVFAKALHATGNDFQLSKSAAAVPLCAISWAWPRM